MAVGGRAGREPSDGFGVSVAASAGLDAALARAVDASVLTSAVDASALAGTVGIGSVLAGVVDDGSLIRPVDADAPAWAANDTVKADVE
jgi:hypothetical protein